MSGGIREEFRLMLEAYKYPSFLLDAFHAEVLCDGLSPAQRKFLAFALDLAAERMASRGDEFDEADEQALKTLRLLALEPDVADTPGFFQPGRTYTVNAPFMAPEIRASFQCIAVAIHPTAGNRRALGFEQEGAGSPWRSSSMRDEEWADGWVDITEGGAPDA